VEEALTAELTKHRDAVKGFVLRLVRDEALAEDLAQETFVRAQRATETRRGEASDRSWLCAITLNLVRDHFRVAKRRPLPVSDPELVERISSNDDTEQTLMKAEMSACIAEYALELPKSQYKVVVLHDTVELPHDEIAALLGISVANSRVLLHRGRAALRHILQQHCILSLDGDAIPCERQPPESDDD
jgi:RNA polymerase sigma-70 factor (ECF subfamily)